MLTGKKLGIIGLGKLAEAIVLGLLKNGALKREDVAGSVKHAESLERVRTRLGVEATLDTPAMIADKDVIILAVKPQNVAKIAEQICPIVQHHQLIISVAASVTTGYIEDRLPPDVPVVRAMPNTPAVVNEGMTVLCKGKTATKEHLALAEEIFRHVGRVATIDEHLMDGVTALSGSGPAYMFLMLESLADAGVKLGIPRDISTLLAAQTMLGASKLALETKQHPAILKDMVTTPAGCTIDGLLELEDGGLRVTLMKAVVKAAERASELVVKKSEPNTDCLNNS
ncbi:pyrroline-5-carboxylate reductase [Chloroherpeton thalassium ATCC 35110]|uniref:Pyrroline-5-carboxylate reductase n=1 Tax=Chloroherpeton thalassium (strain ATCC 35110 / GB-78) TaxID=517418 RepID=B3QY76_CHLT3|nr:pyrroline-5-carboxylate reductase [Chloroherpeton thalassium]ACF15042.1 pyrroline-5-carboxylate reductase [Chloroherpeton thalassium ATCC 35110]